MKKIRLSIPEPCNESWSSFTPTAQGGFCDKCQKDVIDFTSWSDARIAAYFRGKPLNTCGRLYEHQLKTYTDGVRSRGVQAWVPALLTGAAAMLMPEQATAQQTQPETKTVQLQVMPEDQPMVRLPHIQVRGQITNASGDGIPGAVVIQKNTTTGTTANSDGVFTIDLKAPGKYEMLVFSFIGMKTMEIPIPTTEPEHTLNVVLEDDTDILSEVVVSGGISIQRSPAQRFWRRITRPFRR